MEEKPKLTEKPGYFAVIPANVRYDKNLSATAKLMYGEITSLLNFSNKCFATNAYFSRLYEISERQVSRLINELLSQKYIDIKTTNKSTGSERIITLPIAIFVNRGVDENVKRGVVKKVYHNKYTVNIKSLSEDKDNVLFIDFWKNYSNHKGLKEAFKSWGKIPKELHEEIVGKVKPWLIDNGDKFVPMPATWLNQERWNDELTPMQPVFNKPSSSAPEYYNPAARKLPIDYNQPVPQPE